VGRLADEKGADLALEAFARIARRVPGARLTIAGEGPSRRALELRAIALGVQAAVDFAGWVVPGRVMPLINDHAVVIMPSRLDSFPLVALEAGAMARPVVASRVGGFPEIVVHGETGALVAVGDVEALADACARLLLDPDAAGRLGRAARRRVLERFSWSRHVDAYDALYRALVPQERRDIASATP
jgi:glycogen(starch) synthase